jgi:hypothetical protein
MKFNNYQLCLILWLLAEVSTFVLEFIRAHKARKMGKMRELYLQRMKYFMQKGIVGEKMLQELYFSLLESGKNKALCSLIFEGMHFSDANEGISYIEDKLNLFTGDDSIVDNSKNKINRYLRKKKLIFRFQRTVVATVTIALFLKYNIDITRIIAVVVNTIGVVFQILLDYDYDLENWLRRDGKLARKNGLKIPQSQARNLKIMYQLLAGLGVIVNISLYTIHYLEQAI